MSAQGSAEEDNGSSPGSSLDSSSGSYEEESGEYSSEAESSDEEDREEEEPVLKYKRFAKEVVSSINEGSDGEKNIICCIAVHPKVLKLCTSMGIN